MPHPYQRHQKKATKRPEQVLQHSVGQFLDLALPSNAIWLHYPSGGFRRPIEAKIFRALGVRPGVPDLLVFHEGCAYGVELKASGRKLTEAQAAMHARLGACGVPCTVATTLEEVAAFLAPHIPLRARLGGRS